jgi:hypothetical protein
VFVEALESVEAMRAANEVMAACGTVSMANMIEGGRTPLLDASAHQDSAVHLKAHGISNGFQGRMLDFEAYNALVTLDGIRGRQAELEG